MAPSFINGEHFAPATSNGSVPNGAALPYTVAEHGIHEPRPMRLICIGAGIAGIGAAKKYQDQLENCEFQIYEKNDDVGGTWLENQYPGCACDIPAHAYTYTWEGNPNWSRVYVERPELFDYFKGCAVRWNCMRYIKFEHRVMEARWNEEDSRWHLKIEDMKGGSVIEDECDVLLSATGILNKWKWPDIKGLDTFEGRKLHSARWDTEFDFDGKTVAVIGAGSSAIQIVPSLQPIVSKLVSFIRSPTWITPEFSGNMAPDGRQTRYSDEDIERFNKDKEYFLDYRVRLQDNGSKAFPLFFKGSELQQKAYKDYSKMMRERLNHDEELYQHIIPEFQVGCRRFTPGDGFLEALVADNTTVVTEDIQCVTPKGIKTADGIEHGVDVIVCATGFDVSQRPVFPVIGRNGADLRDFWADEPINYLSVTAPGFPNYFITGGPNSPIANGSLISGLETEIDYAYSCLRKMQTENIKSMEVKREAVDDFIEHKNALMEKMVWSGGCRSWYKNGAIDGPVTGPWCGTSWHFNEALRNPRWEDYDFKYRSRNRFSYLGIGRTRGELTGKGQAAKYLSEPGVEKLSLD